MRRAITVRVVGPLQWIVYPALTAIAATVLLAIPFQLFGLNLPEPVFPIVLAFASARVGGPTAELMEIVWLLGLFLLRNAYFLTFEMSARAAAGESIAVSSAGGAAYRRMNSASSPSHTPRTATRRPATVTRSGAANSASNWAAMASGMAYGISARRP